MTPREIDALVAEKVMGCSVTRVGCCGCSGSPHTDDEGYPMTYSTDIADAWQVVEKLQGGLRFELRRRPDGGFWAYFGEEMSAEADTAPMAICLAALKAVGVSAV